MFAYHSMSVERQHVPQAIAARFPVCGQDPLAFFGHVLYSPPSSLCEIVGLRQHSPSFASFRVLSFGVMRAGSYGVRLAFSVRMTFLSFGNGVTAELALTGCSMPMGRLRCCCF